MIIFDRNCLPLINSKKPKIILLHIMKIDLKYEEVFVNSVKKQIEGDKVPKKLSEVKKSKPLQVSLFEMLSETDVLTDDGNKLFKNSRYSQTIELVDFMPRIVWEQQERLRKDYNGLLPGIVRNFECRGVPYELTLTPAMIVKEGKSVASFPGSDEDILEIILRKMYLEGNPQYYDGKPGMSFTVNQIRKELKRQGKTRSHYEVISSLLILAGSGITCKNLLTNRVIVFKTIDVLSFGENKEDNEPCYLIFSDIIAKAIEDLYFRRFNYQQVISYKSSFARLLHRRISHHFTQANNVDKKYTVNLSTLLRDFGFEFDHISRAYKKLLEAVKEMEKNNVIGEFFADPVLSVSKGHRRKIEDYFITIVPTKKFSFEMTDANNVKKRVVQLNEALKENLEPETKQKQKKDRFSGLFPAETK